MTDDEVLRQAVREAIRARKMPARQPDRMWGGPGAGAQCTICGVAVETDEAELELEFAFGDDPPGGYHVHARCFAMWELERDRPPAEARQPDDSAGGRRLSAAVAEAGTSLGSTGNGRRTVST